MEYNHNYISVNLYNIGAKKKQHHFNFHQNKFQPISQAAVTIRLILSLKQTFSPLSKSSSSIHEYWYVYITLAASLPLSGR